MSASDVSGYFHSIQSVDDLLSLKRVDFERYVGYLFLRMGYQVEETVLSLDGGVDLYAQLEGARVVVRWKRWESTVQVRDILEYLGLMRIRRADEGYFVTTSGFSPEVEQTASLVEELHLVGRDELEQWIRQYGYAGASSGEAMSSTSPSRAPDAPALVPTGPQGWIGGLGGRGMESVPLRAPPVLSELSAPRQLFAPRRRSYGTGCAFALVLLPFAVFAWVLTLIPGFQGSQPWQVYADTVPGDQVAVDSLPTPTAASPAVGEERATTVAEPPPPTATPLPPIGALVAPPTAEPVTSAEVVEGELPAQVGEVVMARTVGDDDRPLEISDSFEPTDPRIYVVAEVAHIEEGVELSASWSRDGQAFEESGPFVTDGEYANTWFWFYISSEEEAFVPGRYTVTFNVNGSPVGTKEFQVR